MRTVARIVRDGWDRVRFAAWTLRLRLELRRQGMRLRVEAPHGLHLDSAPRIRALPGPRQGGSLTLRVGGSVRLGYDVSLVIVAGGDSLLELGDDAWIMDTVRIELRRGSIRIGTRTHVRDRAVLKSDGDLRLGNDIQIGHTCTIQCEERIVMADHSGIAELTTLIDSDHAIDGSDRPFLSQPLRVDPVVVGPNTFVARGSVVLRGARLGANCLVGANSVVREGDYPDGQLIAGSPAKVIRALGEVPVAR